MSCLSAGPGGDASALVLNALIARTRNLESTCGATTNNGTLTVKGVITAESGIIVNGALVADDLTITGDISAARLTATNGINGTLLTGPQPNITSLGTLSSIATSSWEVDATGNSLQEGTATTNGLYVAGTSTLQGPVIIAPSVASPPIQVSLTGNLTQTGNITQTGTLTRTGNTTINGNISINGTCDVNSTFTVGTVNITNKIVAGPGTSTLTTSDIGYTLTSAQYIGNISNSGQFYTNGIISVPLPAGTWILIGRSRLTGISGVGPMSVQGVSSGWSTSPTAYDSTLAYTQNTDAFTLTYADAKSYPLLEATHIVRISTATTYYLHPVIYYTTLPTGGVPRWVATVTYARIG